MEALNYKIVAHSRIVDHPETSLVQYVFYYGDKGVVLAEASYFDLNVAQDRQYELIFSQIKEVPFSFEDLREIALHSGENYLEIAG